MFKTRKITAVLFSTALILAVILPCFFVSASAADKASLLSNSKFKSQSQLGLVSEDCPYPEGAFVEVQHENGLIVLYNFDINASYCYGNLDVNGNVINAYFPFTWIVDSSYLWFESTKPIYRYTSSSPSWTVTTTSTTQYQETTYITSNGTVTSTASEVLRQRYRSSASFASTKVCVASVPCCWDSTGGNAPTYRAESSTTPYKLAPFFSSSYLSSVSEVTSANNLATTVSNILSKVSSIKSGTDDINSVLSDLNDNLENLSTFVNSRLARLDAGVSNLEYLTTVVCSYLSEIQGILVDIDTYVQWIDGDILAQTQTLSEELLAISDQLDELMHGGDSFDSEEVFGTDESGLSDITSDFEFSGSGIDSITSTLGNSFRLIKVNFEAICNIFGLNDVIVLLLGFSTICFILGRVVNNRMRGA